MSVNEVSLTGRRRGLTEERDSLRGRPPRPCFHAACLLALVLTGQVLAQHIDTRVLTPSQSMRITVNPNVATTLLFPDSIGGAFGLGLVSAGAHENQAAAPGSIALEHPEGSPLMVLHALTPGAKAVMTVLLDGKLYVFDVQSGAEPDLAVTYLKTDPQVRRGEEVTEEDVRANRVKYDPELLVGSLRRATDAELMRKSSPDLYSDYSVRQGEDTPQHRGGIPQGA